MKKLTLIFILLTAYIPISGFTAPQVSSAYAIDRAFERVSKENGDLRDNTVFAYLYAKEWKDEYRSSCPYEAAFEYARNYASGNAADMYMAIADYFKALALSIGQYSANEDELYEKLLSVNYEGSVPQDFSDLDILTVLDDAANPLPAIAGLPEDEIYYRLSEIGAVLSVKGRDYLYQWDYITPRLVLPRLELADCDGDGKDELTVICYTGSGTGIAVEKLHIFEMDDSGQPEYEITVDGELIENLLFHRLSATYDPSEEEITVTLDGQDMTVDVSNLPKENSNELRGLSTTSIIYFDNNGGKLSVRLSVDIHAFDYLGGALDLVGFNADIEYKDHDVNIKLANCRLVEGSNF